MLAVVEDLDGSNEFCHSFLIENEEVSTSILSALAGIPLTLSGTDLQQLLSVLKKDCQLLETATRDLGEGLRNSRQQRGEESRRQSADGPEALFRLQVRVDALKSRVQVSMLDYLTVRQSSRASIAIQSECETQFLEAVRQSFVVTESQQ